MTHLEVKDLVFYSLGGLTVASAACVVLMTNPVYCAFMLALTMLGISAIFMSLEAYFLAAAQLIIYAGAVMVMFVMVVMLFNLREETRAFSKGFGSLLLKVSSVAIVLGTILSIVQWPKLATNVDGATVPVSTKDLALQLFTAHMISFQFVGLLLLVVLIGAITLAKSKGGTHAS